MHLSAYDTTVGKFLRTADRVDEVIKTLHMSNNLTPSKKEGVYCLTHASSVSFDPIAFPLTLQTHTRQTITVVDERPYRDKKNQVTSPNDIAVMRLAGFLQQDAANLRLTALKNCRNMMAKAFAESVSRRVRGLNILEETTFKNLLAFYIVCLIEPVDTPDLTLVGINVLHEVFRTDREFALSVIEGVPHMKGLEDLLTAAKANPILFKLKVVTMKDFIAILSSLTFSGLGGRVVGAASEAPCLLAGFVYACARFRGLQKTPLGQALDPKHNPRILDAFLRHIDYTYDLNG